MDALAVAADPEHPEHGKVKVFKTTDFGYRRITVERPLMHRFETHRGHACGAGVVEAVTKWDGRDVFLAALRGSWAPSGGRGRRPNPDMINAAVQMGRCGHQATPVGRRSGRPCQSPILTARSRGQGRAPLPDPDLRDYENVPLGRGHRGLLHPRGPPHVPDAWVDQRRPRSATRSLLPATSTSTLPRARSPRSTPNCATWKG